MNFLPAYRHPQLSLDLIYFFHPPKRRLKCDWKNAMAATKVNNPCRNLIIKLNHLHNKKDVYKKDFNLIEFN